VKHVSGVEIAWCKRCPVLCTVLLCKVFGVKCVLAEVVVLVMMVILGSW